MSRIRIIEDKTKNFRGNHDIQMFCIPYVDALFVSQSQKTYNSFRQFARRVAKHFNASEVMILNIDYSQKLTVVYEDYDYETKEYSYKFWYEPKDSKSYKDRIYYSKEELERTYECLEK